jgi:spore germination protein YaaH
VSYDFFSAIICGTAPCIFSCACFSILNYELVTHFLLLYQLCIALPPMVLYIFIMRSYKTIYFLILSFSALYSQEHPSIHQQQWQYYQDHPEEVSHADPNAAAVQPSYKGRSLAPNAVVYGFHPYWVNGNESKYQYDLLSHLAYFSADVDPVTGGFSSTHSYSTAAVITQAKNAGVKVHLTIVLFSKHDSLWAKQSRQDALVNNILAKVKERNIDGVNIDFESMKSSDAAPFKKFIRQLGDTLHKYQKELTVELFAVDRYNIFPASFFTDLNDVVDSYFIMLYAYNYSGSSTAGPNSPLMTTAATSYRHVLRSIKWYTDLGCPPGKLIAGFPYYGIDWPVVSSSRMAATTASGSSRFYNVAKNNYLDTMKAENKFFDATFSTPWYRYQSAAGWRQTWYDDSLSLARKYDSVKTKKIAGIGMWALGYDNPEPELWNLLRAKFTGTTAVVQETATPAKFTLLTNYPNPFNPATTIRFTLPVSGFTTLIVYDALGREAALLVNEDKEAGTYSVQFDASQLASGVYFAKMTSGRSMQFQRMMFLK